jgi:hypothetical protein
MTRPRLNYGIPRIQKEAAAKIKLGHQGLKNRSVPKKRAVLWMGMRGEFTAVSVRMQSLAPRRPLNAGAIELELGCCLVCGSDEDNGSTAQQRESSGRSSTHRSPWRHRLMSIGVSQLGAVQDFAENLEALLVAIKPRRQCHGFPALAVPLSPRPCLELQ